MNAAGHSKSDMSQEYTLVDLSAQDKAVRAFQDRILGKPEEEMDSIGPQWAKFIQELHPEAPDEFRNLLKELVLNGGLE